MIKRTKSCMDKYKLVFFLVSFLSLIYSDILLAQRPKIGLTLSGGGAKGYAQIGILQAIDSAGLQIDYLTGTSIGSIMGAMYATGYSGNQIDSIAKGLDWSVLMSGKPKYTDVGLDEKDEFGKYSLELPFDGLEMKLGTGLIESEEVWLQFSEIFFHVYDQPDFSKFNIPFKCIGTNLSNGDAIVFTSGDLVKALRSSMSLPSIFEAVDYDTAQVVDGGIVRNFPVSDVIEMGADYVIGVNLFSGLSHASELNSAMDVMYQITNYRDAYDLVKQKDNCDILIEPDLTGYSAGSFSSGEEILDVGYKLREKYYPIFKRLADSINSISQVPFDPNNRLMNKKTVIIDEIETVGLEKIRDEIVFAKANLNLGVPVTAKELNKAFRRVYSTLNFKYAYYQLIPTEKGHAKMVMHLSEQYQSQLKIGFSYHTFTTPAVFLNYTTRNLIFDKSRSMAKIAISEDFKGLLEHKQFFGKNLKSALNLSFTFLQQRINIYDHADVSAQYKTSNVNFAAKYQYFFSQYSGLEAVFALRYSQFSPNISSTIRIDGYNKDLQGLLNYQINTLNRPFLPTSGVDAEFTTSIQFSRKYFVENLSSDSTTIDTSLFVTPKDPMFRAYFCINSYKSVGRKTTILTNIQGGALSVLSNYENYYLDNFLIGGSQKLYKNQFIFAGYQDVQLAATSFASGLIGIQYNVWGELYLLGKANIGVYNFISNSGFTNDIDKKIISGFSGTLAYNLSALPFEFSWGYSPEVNKVFSSIRIGFIF